VIPVPKLQDLLFAHMDHVWEQVNLKMEDRQEDLGILV